MIMSKVFMSFLGANPYLDRVRASLSKLTRPIHGSHISSNYLCLRKTLAQILEHLDAMFGMTMGYEVLRRLMK